MTGAEIIRAWGMIERILEARFGARRIRSAIEAIKAVIRAETVVRHSPSPLRIAVLGCPSVANMADDGIGSSGGASVAMLALAAMEIYAEDGMVASVEETEAFALLAAALLKG